MIQDNVGVITNNKGDDVKSTTTGELEEGIVLREHKSLLIDLALQ